jgi:hypothetical protein
MHAAASSRSLPLSCLGMTLTPTGGSLSEAIFERSGAAGKGRWAGGMSLGGESLPTARDEAQSEDVVDRRHDSAISRSRSSSRRREERTGSVVSADGQLHCGAQDPAYRAGVASPRGAGARNRPSSVASPLPRLADDLPAFADDESEARPGRGAILRLGLVSGLSPVL